MLWGPFFGGVGGYTEILTLVGAFKYHWLMGNIEVHHGDCIEVMRTMPENSVDAIVTDPPYGLGFMGKAWDELPPGQEWAEECLRVLKPGGHMLAFGGTRTWHRLAVAIEDAGFEIRDSIAWMYGSGFPKHRAALKPAFEPVVMARKPFKGSLTANESEHGTGALNIDACRVEERWPANVALDEEMAVVLDEQSGILTSGGGVRRPNNDPKKLIDVGFKANDKSWGASSGGASRFYYVAKPSKKERPEVAGVSHTTVKPLALMRWLVRLVTPAGGTVLEPFAGSGTTVEACLIEGLRCIAIEQEAEYLPLIHARIERQAA